MKVRMKPPVNGGRNYNGPKVAKFCRVSSDPHERRNDLWGTVSTRDSGNLNTREDAVTRDRTERPHGALLYLILSVCSLYSIGSRSCRYRR